MACPGVYKPGPEDTIGKCYTYDILSAICIEIGHSVDIENAEERWEYRGGCYENGSPVLMERATPGRVYEFDYIPIEVRADDDPYTAISKSGNMDSGRDLSYFGWLGSVMFSFSLIGAVVFVISFLALQKTSQKWANTLN